MEKYIAIAKELFENKHRHIGVRSLCDDEQYVIGDDCRDSYEWDFENDCSTYHTTGETANGTCATWIVTNDLNFHFYDDEDVATLASNIAKAVELNNAYVNGPQAIIAGDGSRVDGHFDDNEIRILNAFVVALID